jgi:hypothetical protein
MALAIGSETADAGMSQAIYQELDKQLSPPLQKAVDEAAGDAKGAAQKALDGARESWQKLSFCVAQGVINHLIAHMEIVGIQTGGNVNAAGQGQTALADPGHHQHNVNLSATQNSLVFTQSNDGVGHIR